MDISINLSIEELARQLDNDEIDELIELRNMQSPYGDPESIRSHLMNGRLEEAIVEISRFNEAFRDLEWLYRELHGAR